jgi:peptidoglycan/xylan/chitin deacetylase (PgdA/CDA1 family)
MASFWRNAPLLVACSLLSLALIANVFTGRPGHGAGARLDPRLSSPRRRGPGSDDPADLGIREAVGLAGGAPHSGHSAACTGRRVKRRQLPQHGPVVLTADDSHRSVYPDMYPLIRRYQVPVTLFIHPSAISNADYTLTWKQLREMVAIGLLHIQSHTYWHPDFRVEARRLAPAAYAEVVKRQLALSKERFEAKLGIKVDLLAWPFGICDQFLERLAAETGYVAAFTIEPGPVRIGGDPLALPWNKVTDADRGARFAALVLGGTATVSP